MTFKLSIYMAFGTTESPLFFFLDAIYDCSSLYTKSYRISGEYKLPKDDFLGTPELSVSATVWGGGGAIFGVCISSHFGMYASSGLLRYGDKRRRLDGDPEAQDRPDLIQP